MFFYNSYRQNLTESKNKASLFNFQFLKKKKKEKKKEKSEKNYIVVITKD